MWRSLVIGVAAAVVLTASVGGVGIALALQAPSAVAPATVQKADSGAPGAAPICGMRKVWVGTDWGPRLKWRRACAPT